MCNSFGDFEREFGGLQEDYRSVMPYEIFSLMAAGKPWSCVSLAEFLKRQPADAAKADNALHCSRHNCLKRVQAARIYPALRWTPVLPTQQSKMMSIRNRSKKMLPRRF